MYTFETHLQKYPTFDGELLGDIVSVSKHHDFIVLQRKKRKHATNVAWSQDGGYPKMAMYIIVHYSNVCKFTEEKEKDDKPG
jgi:hypothetical protein